MTFKPLLAATADIKKDPDVLSKIKYPVFVSPKYDGIRAIVKDGVVLSRKLLPTPSKQVQEMFGGLEGFDGELIAGDPTEPNIYNKTASYVMSKDKVCDDLRFYVFDNVLSVANFRSRFDLIRANSAPHTYKVPQNVAINLSELLDYEAMYLAEGYEGMMIRSLDGIYKHGRSTFKEGILIKLKRFEDDEAVVTGFVEMQHNLNEKKRDELGHAKRSSEKAGKVDAGILGKFICKYHDEEIDVACGVLTHEEREEIWNNRAQYEGKILKFRFFAYGVKNKPRFPRFIGWRDPIDM